MPRGGRRPGAGRPHRPLVMLPPGTPARDVAIATFEVLQSLYRAARRGNAGAARLYLRNEPERLR